MDRGIGFVVAAGGSAGRAAAGSAVIDADVDSDRVDDGGAQERRGLFDPGAETGGRRHCSRIKLQIDGKAARCCYGNGGTGAAGPTLGHRGLGLLRLRGSLDQLRARLRARLRLWRVSAREGEAETAREVGAVGAIAETILHCLAIDPTKEFLKTESASPLPKVVESHAP